MIVRHIPRLARAAACLLAAGAVPAAAVEFSPAGRPFEALMADDFRIIAAAGMPGLVVPTLLLGKDGSPDVYICVQQIRDCPRLVDSPNNNPLGLKGPSAPDALPR